MMALGTQKLVNVEERVVWALGRSCIGGRPKSCDNRSCNRYAVDWNVTKGGGIIGWIESNDQDAVDWQCLRYRLQKAFLSC
jgi:chitodextrinase